MLKRTLLLSCLPLSCLALSACAASPLPSSHAPESGAPKVYVGVADQWDDLVSHPAGWTFVRQNADGFYVNFIEMEWAAKGQHGKSQETLDKTAALFAHKNAYFESDYKLDGQSEADDDRDIDMLQSAGFTVPYTSLNTGWDVPRYRSLKTYHLLPRQKPRYSFVQDGPWTINGDLDGDVSTGGLFPNADYRHQVDQADGDTTDGPLGFWFYGPGVGFNRMQSGSYSMVKYAHAQGKPAVVMLCPYGAGISTYDARTMYLSTGEDCVRRHEDNDAEPEVWDVFEYATSIGAIPEQVNGAPAPDSTTAMAYYLIKHLQGDPATLHLSAGPVGSHQSGMHQVSLGPAARNGTILHSTVTLTDTSSWLDYAAVLKAAQTGATKAWGVRFTLKGWDITSRVLGRGFKFYQADRINPNTATVVDVTFTRTSSRGSSGLRLTTQLLPHQGRPAMDTVIFAAR